MVLLLQPNIIYLSEPKFPRVQSTFDQQSDALTTRLPPLYITCFIILCLSDTAASTMWVYDLWLFQCIYSCQAAPLIMANDLVYISPMLPASAFHNFAQARNRVTVTIGHRYHVPKPLWCLLLESPNDIATTHKKSRSVCQPSLDSLVVRAVDCS